MNKSIKFIFLMVMLAIPAAIFTFLKFFGDNRFDVEIFYQNGNEGVNDCPMTSGQYYLADSLISYPNRIHIVLFVEGNDSTQVRNIKARLLDTFNDQVSISLIGGADFDMASQVYENIDKIITCGFLSKDKDDLILVDSQRRIRGYYKRDLDEIDRLIVETKIIVENEQRDE